MSFATEYLDQLPAGIASYPDCVSRANTSTKDVEAVPPSKLDPRLREALAQLSSDWWPTAVRNGIIASLRDHLGNDEETLEFLWQRSVEIYRSPLYRALMLVMSPSLALMGAARRWSTFHRGTDLSQHGFKNDGNYRVGELKLDHPPGLFLPFHHRQVATAFNAAASLTGVDRSDFHVETTSRPDGATFRVRYLR